MIHQREEQACEQHEATEPPGVAGQRSGIPQRQKVIVAGYYPSWERSRPVRFHHPFRLASPRVHSLTARSSNNCGTYLSSRYLASHRSCTTGVQRGHPPGMERLDQARPVLERASEGLIPRLGGGDAAHNVLAVAHVEIEVSEKFLFGQRGRGID